MGERLAVLFCSLLVGESSTYLHHQLARHLTDEKQKNGRKIYKYGDNSSLANDDRFSTMCTAASRVLLAETWSEDVDPTGWWMSEKLDGVR